MVRPCKALTSTFILHKTRKDRLESVTELNAWGQDVDDVSILSQAPHIKLIALACNCISSLRQFKQCHQLQQLLLRKNEVADIRELQHLTTLQNLHTLTLSENPVSEVIDYRSKVLALLPRLVKLDDKAVTAEEVEAAHVLYPDGLSGLFDINGPINEALAPESTSPYQTPPYTPGASRRASAADGPLLSPGMPSAGRRSLQGDWMSDRLDRGPKQQAGLDQQHAMLPPQQQQQQRRPSPHQLPPLEQGLFGSPLQGVQQFQGPDQDTQLGIQAQQQQQQYPSPKPSGRGDPNRLPYSPAAATAASGARPHVSSASALPQRQDSTQLQQARSQQQPAMRHGGSETADNVFYAIVALLPELTQKHLQWARDEIDARLLELQQLSLEQ